jgi:BolA protein
MKILDTRLILKNSIESLEKLLQDTLTIQRLDILDESLLHANHMPLAKSNLTHVRIRIQAAELEGLSRVEQHRKLYAILQPAIDSGLHAIQFEIS